MAQVSNNAAADAPVVREYADPALLGVIRTELLISEKVRAHVEGAYNSQENYQLFNEQYKFYTQAGIDANMGGRWYIGGSARFSRNFYDMNSLLSRAHVSHLGKLGSLYLQKELSGELFTYARSGTYKPPVQARLGFGFALGKHWDDKTVPLYIQLSGKLYFNRYFDDLYQTVYQQRFIDQTRLRLEGGVRPVDWCWISLFSMLDTRYYYRLGIYDSNGNAINGEARVNEIFPVFGMQATFVFKSDRQESYHPGLPLR
jgi:hypothetical protein